MDGTLLGQSSRRSVTLSPQVMCSAQPSTSVNTVTMVPGLPQQQMLSAEQLNQLQLGMFSPGQLSNQQLLGVCNVAKDMDHTPQLKIFSAADIL